MAESFVLIKDNYKEVCEKYLSITKCEITSCDDQQILAGDIQFEDMRGWCLITSLLGDNFAEDILLELSDGKRLIYCFSDEDQMDCEFLVAENNQIIRKKYIYSDTPELDEDEGRLRCEIIKKFLHWNDIDYFIGKARVRPDGLFKGKH